MVIEISAIRGGETLYDPFTGIAIGTAITGHSMKLTTGPVTEPLDYDEKSVLRIEFVNDSGTGDYTWVIRTKQPLPPLLPNKTYTVDEIGIETIIDR